MPDHQLHDRSHDDLLRAVAAGDRHAFAALYDELVPTVMAVTGRVLDDPTVAAEVARDTFLEVWRQAPTYDLEAWRARVWVMALARRRAVERSSSRSTEPTSVDRGPRSAPAGTHPSSHEALALVRDHALTYDEVAQILGVSDGAVAALLTEGLRHVCHLPPGALPPPSGVFGSC